MKSTVDGVDFDVDSPMYLTVVFKDPPETPSAPPTEKSPLCCADTVTPNAIAAIKMIIFFIVLNIRTWTKIMFIVKLSSLGIIILMTNAELTSAILLVVEVVLPDQGVASFLEASLAPVLFPPD